jgi:hypothetical protein
VPVVAQTLSRFSDTGTALGATTSMGSTTPARRWVIPRTRPVNAKSSSIAVLNTGVTPAKISVAVVHEGVIDRPARLQDYALPAGARVVLPSGLSGVTRTVDTAVVVTSSVPVFAEWTLYAKQDATRSAGIPTR